MMLSEGRGYVFIHIPKTGGTSMALALEARAMKDDIMLGDTPKALKRRRRLRGATARGRLWKHATLADIDGLVTPETLAGLFAFTLVRNPWDRMVSYYHWLQTQKFDHPSVRLAQRAGFEDFLRAPATQVAQRNWPASRYMTNAAGDEHCNAYIRLEHFAQDAAPLMDHLGFDLALGRENCSDRGENYRDYYSNETQRIVSECCAADIAQFCYKF